jgi:hypothetical protein
MTCDEVFDLLTLPHGAANHQHLEALQLHLAGCRSCRRLADALEPAVEMLRRNAADDACASPALLNGPWNEVVRSAGAAVAASPTEASRGNWSVLSAAEPASQRWLWDIFRGDLMRLAAAVLVGLTLGALVWGQNQSLEEDASTDGSSRITLAALRLTAECLPAEHRTHSAPGPRLRPAGELLASTELDALNCCTLCHTSLGMAPTSKAATLQVVRSCQACHTF